MAVVKHVPNKKRGNTQEISEDNTENIAEMLAHIYQETRTFQKMRVVMKFSKDIGLNGKVKNQEDKDTLMFVVGNIEESLQLEIGGWKETKKCKREASDS